MDTPTETTTTATAAPTIDVAVYGIVNAGKSSLINALMREHRREIGPIGGTTAEIGAESYREVATRIGPYAVRLLDTPGLEEIDGEPHANLATDTAERADLVLFVTAEDLTAAAHDAIRALRGVGKPMLVVLNKEDLLDPDQESAILAAIRATLADEIDPRDVIPIAAHPVVRRKVVGDDGTSRFETVRDEPRIGGLEDRLLAVIAEAAAELRELAIASEAVERHRIAAEADLQARRKRAERAADETAAAWATTLAINPIPLLDFLAGPAGIAVLVVRVARIYEADVGLDHARALSSEILRAGKAVMWGSLAGIGIGGALKFVPGLGHIAGGLTQAISAGIFGHVVGRAVVAYHENGRDWGHAGLKETLRRIAAETDRKAITNGLADRLKDNLAAIARGAFRRP